MDTNDITREAEMVALRPAAGVSLDGCLVAPDKLSGHLPAGTRIYGGAVVVEQNDDEYTVVSAHPDVAAAEAAVTDGQTVAGFRYGVYAAEGSVLIAERDLATGALDIVANAEDDEWAVEEAIGDAECDGCGAYSADGEGYDGYCGNCADRLDAAGHWD